MQPGSQAGWFKATRSTDAMELLAANPDAFALAYVIAYRAQWSTRFNRHGLQLGEAFLGDFREYGMTERRYRTAKSHLEKWGFATFQPTNKGTVAKLADCRLFDVLLATHGDRSDGPNDRPETDDRRAGDGQATTTEEEKKTRAEEQKNSDTVFAATESQRLARISKKAERLDRAKPVLKALNEASGRNYREIETNLALIAARIEEEGVTVDGCIQMVRRQAQRWSNTDKAEYLRPETLFGKEKFDGYYAAKDLPVAPPSPQQSVPQYNNRFGTSTGPDEGF